MKQASSYINRHLFSSHVFLCFSSSILISLSSHSFLFLSHLSISVIFIIFCLINFRPTPVQKIMIKQGLQEQLFFCEFEMLSNYMNSFGYRVIICLCLAVECLSVSSDVSMKMIILCYIPATI